MAAEVAIVVQAPRPQVPALARPPTRPLRIFALDPMAGRSAGNRVTIAVENERLEPGPLGDRVEVVDFDGVHGRFYPAVDLDDPRLLMQQGLAPDESDPRFHQQMVYAVAMRTLENFDRALGRRLHMSLGKGRTKLRLYPHAFYGENAFFDPKLNAVLFGYFRADAERPGPNLPGQTVFTCLSHDIIVHEVTHAAVHKLRRHFAEWTNPDVPAFHEAFADIVALFQHFSYAELLRDRLGRSRADIRQKGTLVELAGQFGHATGRGQPLRTALDEPDPARLAAAFEPHERGAILVGAVFDAFFTLYERRTRDLIRIATGGTGLLPQGDLHPDLVARVAAEAADAAQQVLTMCIRAFDYLPVADVTFGDFLRALVTADHDLDPSDPTGRRAAFIEAFRRRGIYADGVVSLAEESLLLPPAPADVPPIPFEDAEMAILDEFVSAATERSQRRGREAEPQAGAAMRGTTRYQKYLTEVRQREVKADDDADVEHDPRRFYGQLHGYAMRNREALRLHPGLGVAVTGGHTVFRVSPEGQLLVEFVAQFTQVQKTADPVMGGLRRIGGTTVVASWDGTVRYVIAKPLPGDHLPLAERPEAERRHKAQGGYVQRLDERDPRLAYMDAGAVASRMRSRMHLKALHGG